MDIRTKNESERLRLHNEKKKLKSLETGYLMK